MMKSGILLRLAAVGAIACFLFPAAAEESAKKPAHFLIGNSLTWDTVPSKLDGDVQWHVDCGKNLAYIYENPEMPCVKSSTLWPKALNEKQYDLISVQSHYGTTLDEEAAVISEWVWIQPKATFVIHTGWARSESRAVEYAAEEATGKMQHCRAYIDALLTKLRELHPDRKFHQTHAQELLAKLAADIEANVAPFEKVEEIYRDAIHMNVVAGRYLMHNAMRHAMRQARSHAGFEKIDPKLKAYLDSLLDTLDG